MKTVLSIAGSDSSGGAGVQADIKTITAHGVFATTAITSLTAQNTTGVLAFHPVPEDFLASQIEAVVLDIKPDAVKIGMIPTCAHAEKIISAIKKYSLKNIVVDPVMISSSGFVLTPPSVVETMKNGLFPLVSLITPNLREAEALLESSVNKKTVIDSREKMEEAASLLALNFKCAVLLKGGHSVTNSDDLLCSSDGKLEWFTGERIENPNTHGTGCTLSSALASNLAKGFSLSESVARAKKYMNAVLRQKINLGKGSGPLWHAVDF